MAAGAVAEDRTLNLSEVEAVVGRWCDQLVAGRLSGTQAADAAGRLAVLTRRLTASQTVVASRAAECNAYDRRATSAEEWRPPGKAPPRRPRGHDDEDDARLPFA